MKAFSRRIPLRLTFAFAWVSTLFAFGSAPAVAQGNPEAMAIPAYFSLDNNPILPNPHGHEA